MEAAMATVISLINLKGGVGKTTTTLALADILAYEYKYKVLVIDLDPQTNVTVALIHQDDWEEGQGRLNTKATFFRRTV